MEKKSKGFHFTSQVSGKEKKMRYIGIISPDLWEAFFLSPFRQRYHVATYCQVAPKLFSPGNISMRQRGGRAKWDIK